MKLNSLHAGLGPKKIAEMFGWQDAEGRTSHVSLGATSLRTYRTFVAGESAAMFSVVEDEGDLSATDLAALFSYHTNTQWALVADQGGMQIINPHWMYDGAWYKLPHISWDDFERNEDLFASLSPEGIVQRRAVTAATRRKEPSSFLKPVDDALVERLDKWREQAMAYSKDDDRLDEKLQTFYAQLFVLRTIEDRGLDKSLPELKSVIISGDKFDWNAWETILTFAQERIGSDLFSNNVIKEMPEHVLAGVVRDLYVPVSLPTGRARYNFSWIDADLLGLAYEKYLATILKPASLIDQIDFFLPPQKDISRISVRKSAGAYYTPKYITNFIATKSIDQFYEFEDNATLPSIIDFSCGSGSFLVSAIDRLLAHLKRNDPNRAWAKELIDGGYVAGIDIDEKAVTAARLHLWQRLLEEPEALPLPNLSQVIRVGDGLDEQSWGPLNKKYDIAIGNPPFLSTPMVSESVDLRSKFTTATGRFDFSSLFLEQATNILNEKGVFGFVIPNRLFRNKSGEPLRKLITEKASILQVVDFGSTRPFDADAYVGCLIGYLRGNDEPIPQHTSVIEVISIEADFLAALLLLGEDAPKTNENTIKAFRSRHPKSGKPWRLLSEDEEILRIRLEDQSVLLDTLALIPQGIRTGANDLFLFELIAEDSGDLVRLYNDVVGEILIEADLVRPAISGSKLQRYDNVETNTRLIYPYRGNAPIEEAILRQRFPKAWQYFESNREFLGGRSSLQKSGGRFYELVWPRNEEWLRQPKLLIRDLAPKTAFAVDAEGGTYLVGGTAVVPNDIELLFPLLGYLNSEPVNALVRQTTPEFRGGFQKFEPQHIQRIPVVERLLQDDMIAGEIGFLAQSLTALESDHSARRKIEQKIDNIVLELFSEAGVAPL